MTSTKHRPTERVLNILELLATNNNGLTLTELSKALNAPKSSIMPLVHTMTAKKFIYMEKGTGKYFIGIATFSVGSAYINNMNTLQFIQTEMKNIVNLTNETCQLGIQKKDKLLYIAKEDSLEPIRLVSYVGKQLPLYCTALGKAILAEKTNDEILELYPNGLNPITNNTITSFSTLFKELDLSKELGYTVEHEESTPHVNCIGVSLVSNNNVLGALSVAIPSFRFSDEKLSFVIDILKSSKTKLETYFNNTNTELENLY